MQQTNERTNGQTKRSASEQANQCEPTIKRTNELTNKEARAKHSIYQYTHRA